MNARSPSELASPRRQRQRVNNLADSRCRCGERLEHRARACGGWVEVLAQCLRLVGAASLSTCPTRPPSPVISHKCHNTARTARRPHAQRNAHMQPLRRRHRGLGVLQFGVPAHDRSKLCSSRQSARRSHRVLLNLCDSLVEQKFCWHCVRHCA